MTQPALRLLLKICQRQRRNEDGEGGKKKKTLPAPFFFFYPNMGLFSFGYLNKLPDGGGGGPRILISCCCGKVNERVAAGEAGRVLHHGAFYDRPSPPLPYAHSLTPRPCSFHTAWDKTGDLDEGRMCLLQVHCASIHPFLCRELNTSATLWQRPSVTIISHAGHA